MDHFLNHGVRSIIQDPINGYVTHHENRLNREEQLKVAHGLHSIYKYDLG